MMRRIGFLGFGEAAMAFTGDANWNADSHAYDVKLAHKEWRSKKLRDCKTHNVSSLESYDALAQSTSVILSLVTADQAREAAISISPSVSPGTLFLDMNSVAPETKCETAAQIQAAGATYVDVAIMAPVFPSRLKVPLLVSGPDAEEGAELLAACGFENPRVIGNKIGDASTIKMIRSVMIKGMEALTAECFLAANKAGLVNEISAALGEDWRDRANYNLDRMLVHGQRRAAEMEEVCKTLSGLGVEPILSTGTAQWQETLGALQIIPPPRSLDEKLSTIHQTPKASAA